ncbi:MAG: HDIG domain-containing protein, partial [bacterium]|nr:HDIG domain-containing protein [bacterium]
STASWLPPFPYRVGDTPARDLDARVRFFAPDKQATDQAKFDAVANVVTLYARDNQHLDDLKTRLVGRLFEVNDADSLEDLEVNLWNGFFLPTEEGGLPEPQQLEAGFLRLKTAIAADENLTRTQQAINRALEPLYQTGILENLKHQLREGSQTKIMVYPKGQPKNQNEVLVQNVRIGDIAERLELQLTEELQAALKSEQDGREVARRVYAWLRQRLSDAETLTYDATASKRKANDARLAVKTVMLPTYPGQKLVGIEAGQPLDIVDIETLRREYEAYIGLAVDEPETADADAGARYTTLDAIMRTAAYLGMFAAIYLLCGVYAIHRDFTLLKKTGRLGAVLALASAAIIVASYVSRDPWRCELIPIILFGMTMSIALKQELALLLSTCVALITVVTVGMGLSEFVIIVAGVAAATVLSQQVRSRTQLLFAGSVAAAVAMSTAFGVQFLMGQTSLDSLLRSGWWFAFSAILAGFLMTGLTPFVERTFDVQTHLSLLVLGDQTHPLLQALIRKAPGTYNHSINVASIAEAAAESIGANGLLVRVGAYFHDVGKMLKPQYFIENQHGDNAHEALAPAMSTLVIIAHVKDGADLAKQNNLPQTLIDFIEQHHGTTLVEYFYNRAREKSEENPDASTVDEASF